jgi:hypothetical protein
MPWRISAWPFLHALEIPYRPPYALSLIAIKGGVHNPIKCGLHCGELQGDPDTMGQNLERLSFYQYKLLNQARLAHWSLTLARRLAQCPS